jgi:hypothetical protein
MLGKNVLRRTPWTDQQFAEALEADIANVNEPAHARSLVSVVAILADHITHLRVLGKHGDLAKYTDMLHAFLARQPRLQRIRDLDVAAQVGVRLDALFQDLYAANKVVTPSRARELITTAAGAETKRSILEALLPRPMNTTELIAASKAGSRQHLHGALHPLRALGLVTSMPVAGGTTIHEATPLAHQLLNEVREEEDRRKAWEDRGSLRRLIEEKTAGEAVDLGIKRFFQS